MNVLRTSCRVPDVSFILTKFGLSRRIFVKVPNVKFKENPSSGSLYTTSGQTDRQTC